MDDREAHGETRHYAEPGRAAGTSVPVVGVGASAGGLEVFRHLLAELPVDSGLAIVFIQHLDPKHHSMLAEILGRATQMPVSEAADGMPVEADHVYVIPANTDLTIAGGLLRLDKTQVAFWDVDAPATLAAVEIDLLHPFRTLIPEYDYIFTYGGGPAVVEHYLKLGARACYPIYNALDPATHYPVPADTSLQCDLVFVGNRMPDREKRMEGFFLAAAELAPEFQFVLGGEGWGGKQLPANVRWIGHVGTGDHNRVNCSARLVLNINRDSMANVGFSPPTRVFEAAGAAACLITDHWRGIEEFFAPGCEILVAHNGGEIADLLRTVDAKLAREIGESMRKRARQEHTYSLRALQVREIISQGSPDVLSSRSNLQRQPA